jgi:nitrite reductase (NO-forming)
VDLEVVEVVADISDGVQYTFWTFGGKVPGKFIRIREGDTVEFHLANNPNNKLPHNIDLHAVTGPGGGAASSFTAPGHKSQFTFKALNAGLYVYHCATAPVGMHVGNGMYGLIYVQPAMPLPAVDKEYYVMQGDFYTQAGYGERGHQAFSMQKAIDEHPTYVVFNGSTSGLTGERALKAKVGEKVRLFIGNGGPNLVSSFHVIGEIFDTVYTEGGTLASQKNIQTTIVPAGGSAIAEFQTDVPGTFILVDHSLFRAFNKGALGMLKVEGAENKPIYSGKEVDETYLGDQGQSDAGQIKKLKEEYKEAIKESPKLQKLNKEILMAEGNKVFSGNCLMCHQAKGEGVPAVFPPLAKSDYLAKLAAESDRTALIAIPLNGLSGTIKVNGQDYNSIMPPIAGLTDTDLAAVLTYITNSWGSSAKPFSVEEIQKARSDLTNSKGRR